MHKRDPIYWDDAYPIALMLRRAHPEVDPLQVPDAELRQWVARLDGFADDVDGGVPELLDGIRAEWVELK